MKKLIFILCMVCSFQAFSSDSNSMHESLRIAKAFCSANPECIDILALELDSAYDDGVRDSISKSQWSSLINRKAKQLNNLCDKAPNVEVCKTYRDQLILRYIVGLSSSK